jgi:hypothetical protein
LLERLTSTVAQVERTVCQTAGRRWRRVQAIDERRCVRYAVALCSGMQLKRRPPALQTGTPTVLLLGGVKPIFDSSTSQLLMVEGLTSAVFV